MAETPVYSVAELLNSFSPPIRDIADRLREIILEFAPDVSEKANRGWRSISFRDLKVGYFCGIFPFEEHVDLIFEFGALLPDPEGILLGDTKQVRYLRFHEPEDIQNEVVEHYLKAALDLPPQHAARRGMTQAQGDPSQ